MFAGHIVIGIFADDDSPLLGLRNLVMPLRCSPICFLIMCNYFNGTWYNHKTWFYKTTLDFFKIDHLHFYGLTHIFLFVDKSCFVCVGFINHVNDHYRRGCLHIDAGLQTSHTLTYATSLLWETWPSLCGSGACSGGLNLLCEYYFGHFIIGALAQKHAKDLDYGRKPTEQSWHQGSEGTSQNKQNLF